MTCLEILQKRMDKLGDPLHREQSIEYVSDASVTFETVSGTIEHFQRTGESMAPAEADALRGLRRDAALSLAARALQFWTAYEE